MKRRKPLWVGGGKKKVVFLCVPTREAALRGVHTALISPLYRHRGPLTAKSAAKPGGFVVRANPGEARSRPIRGVWRKRID